MKLTAGCCRWTFPRAWKKKHKATDVSFYSDENMSEACEGYKLYVRKEGNTTKLLALIGGCC